MITNEKPKELLKILYPDLNDDNVNAIVVCLISHLLVESKINKLIYTWLNYDVPTTDNVKKSEDKLHINIKKMDFLKKYSLVEPFFGEFYPEEANDIYRINDLRNDIFHGRAIKDAKFKNGLLSENNTINAVFESAQLAAMAIDKFVEYALDQQYLKTKWAKRLEELGEALY